MLSCVWLYAAPLDCSLPSSSDLGIFQARTLEWVAISSSRASSWPGDWTHVFCISCTGKWILCPGATWEAPEESGPRMPSTFCFVSPLVALRCSVSSCWTWNEREEKPFLLEVPSWKRHAVLYSHSFSKIPLHSVQFSSVTQLCPTLCDPMNRSTPGLPVHHQLPEFIQAHVHWVGDAIQLPHPLSSPSPPAPNPSQHQGLFQWINSLHEVAKVLEFQLQHQSFQWTPRTWGWALGWTGWISLQSKGLSRVFSNTTVQKHQFFDTQLSSQSNSHIHTWPLEKP